MNFSITICFVHLYKVLYTFTDLLITLLLLIPSHYLIVFVYLCHFSPITFLLYLCNPYLSNLQKHLFTNIYVSQSKCKIRVRIKIP
ncbi:hypothetical protein BpHYR1_022925 [Brachionus plicatilis]|uniref:Uncharacterized protein n=1 Tax=Brachionus plicatilis TaxID=10195 RepID=A0A3M7T5M0_BRAPC|nr:hypothetical protein BpHYR1_022925 [Brachionus plicatilis]